MTDRDPRPTQHQPTESPELTDPTVVAAFEGWKVELPQIRAAVRGYEGGYR